MRPFCSNSLRACLLTAGHRGPGPVLSAIHLNQHVPCRSFRHLFRPFFTPVASFSTRVWVDSPMYAEMLEVRLWLLAMYGAMAAAERLSMRGASSEWLLVRPAGHSRRQRQPGPQRKRGARFARRSQSQGPAADFWRACMGSAEGECD